MRCRAAAQPQRDMVTNESHGSGTPSSPWLAPRGRRRLTARAGSDSPTGHQDLERWQSLCSRWRRRARGVLVDRRLHGGVSSASTTTANGRHLRCAGRRCPHRGAFDNRGASAADPGAHDRGGLHNDASTPACAHVHCHRGHRRRHRRSERRYACASLASTRPKPEPATAPTRPPPFSPNSHSITRSHSSQAADDADGSRGCCATSTLTSTPDINSSSRALRSRGTTAATATADTPEKPSTYRDRRLIAELREHGLDCTRTRAHAFVLRAELHAVRAHRVRRRLCRRQWQWPRICASAGESDRLRPLWVRRQFRRHGLLAKLLHCGVGMRHTDITGRSAVNDPLAAVRAGRASSPPPAHRCGITPV